MERAPSDHRRRVPQQERSRQRVESILAAAHGLVVEAGSDALTMFPDKAALVRELALRFMDRVRKMVVAALVDLDTAAVAVEHVDALLAGYHELFLQEPDVRDIWAAAQSDKELQRLDLEDSRENGRLIAAALTHLVRPRDRARLQTLCLLHVHLVGAGARLALALGVGEGGPLMNELRRSVRRDLEEILVDRRQRR
jgi:AcrR family transcriptional regulator